MRFFYKKSVFFYKERKQEGITTMNSKNLQDILSSPTETL